MRLFQAHSLVKRLQRDDVAFSDVVINWFRVGNRASSPAPYRDLIADYHDLDGPRRAYAERFIDELFTSAEIDQLEKYLRQVHTEQLDLYETDQAPLTTHPVSLPVKDPVMGYRDLPRGGLADSYLLADQPGYDLPFRVYGYFDLAKDGYPQKLNQGVAYVQRALQVLGVDKGIKQQDIKDTVEKLYRRNRLFVTQETTYKDWLRKVDV